MCPRLALSVVPLPGGHGMLLRKEVMKVLGGSVARPPGSAVLKKLVAAPGLRDLPVRKPKGSSTEAKQRVSGR